jgi:hypothetical protein
VFFATAPRSVLITFGLIERLLIVFPLILSC